MSGQILDDKHPREIFHVSCSMFSVARYSMGCRINGVDYVYDPTRDALIRGDVLRDQKREAKAVKKAAKQKGV